MVGSGEGHGTVYKGVGDVQVPADVLKNYEEAIKALGHIDVIVLSAGMGWTQYLEDYSVEDFDTIINTNLKGAFFWLKAVLPAFKKRKSGQIVIVNSIFGLNVTAKGFSIYSASKHALTGMAEGLRMEVAGTGIKVASVFPGVVDTPIWTGPNWEKTNIDPQQFGISVSMAPEDVSDTIATIAYQHPRSDIDTLRIFPNYGPNRTRAG